MERAERPDAGTLPQLLRGLDLRLAALQRAVERLQVFRVDLATLLDELHAERGSELLAIEFWLLEVHCPSGAH